MTAAVSLRWRWTERTLSRTVISPQSAWRTSPLCRPHGPKPSPSSFAGASEAVRGFFEWAVGASFVYIALAPFPPRRRFNNLTSLWTDRTDYSQRSVAASLSLYTVAREEACRTPIIASLRALSTVDPKIRAVRRVCTPKCSDPLFLCGPPAARRPRQPDTCAPCGSVSPAASSPRPRWSLDSRRATFSAFVVTLPFTACSSSFAGGRAQRKRRGTCCWTPVSTGTSAPPPP
mmetsp:Transcript_11922/g.33589  ORF Transcript_11922/g.33589 Transcript_11922/m.33589 type:complete len:232 (+) Transcript_11922:350-1045(+)